VHIDVKLNPAVSPGSRDHVWRHRKVWGCGVGWQSVAMVCHIARTMWHLCWTEGPGPAWQVSYR